MTDTTDDDQTDETQQGGRRTLCVSLKRLGNRICGCWRGQNPDAHMQRTNPMPAE